MAGSKQTLLIVDMINDFHFKDGEKLFKAAVPCARAIAKLRVDLSATGATVIYVNDKFGETTDNFGKICQRVRGNSEMGRTILDILSPSDKEYFVLKTDRSGFFETSLTLLLEHFETKELIITGIATDICVLFTANDAYMRGYDLWVPEDCTAAGNEVHKIEALDMIVRNMDGDTRESAIRQISSRRDRGPHSVRERTQGA